MKKSPLTFVGLFFVLIAIILTAVNLQKTPQTKQSHIIEKEVVVKTPRTHDKSISSEEVTVVEYSTRAFLKEK